MTAWVSVVLFLLCSGNKGIVTVLMLLELKIRFFEGCLVLTTHVTLQVVFHC